jgi:hypothetical protein
MRQDVFQLLALVGRIEQRAHLEAGNETVCDADVLGRPRLAQRTGAFQHDGVVGRRIN